MTATEAQKNEWIEAAIRFAAASGWTADEIRENPGAAMNAYYKHRQQLLKEVTVEDIEKEL